LIPCGIAAVYLVVFITQLRHNLWLIGWSSDYSSAFTVPETLIRTGTGGHTVLAPYALYVPLWFGLLTARLPLHREFWEVSPTLLFVASALALGWSVAQVATRRIALFAVLIVLVASPWALSTFMAAVDHNTVYPSTALLGVYLIWLARGEGRRRATAFAVPLLAGIALGTSLASDVLLVPTGIAPLFLTAVLAGTRRDRLSRLVALSALSTVAVSLPVAWLTSTVMTAQGYRTNALSTGLAPLSTLPAHLQLLRDGLERLFNGYLGNGEPGALHGELGLACKILMFAALLTLLVTGVRCATSFVLSGRRAGHSAPVTKLALSLHTIYWTGSAAMACGAFLLSGFLDSDHEPFYATVIFSVAAIVPLFMRSRSPLSWLIPLGASIFFVASAVGVASYPVLPTASLAPYESTIVRLAREHHVKAGYAGYWDASGLTWTAHEQVAVRPVFACSNPGGANLCVFPQETVASWYIPKREQSFLLVNKTLFSVTSLPAGLGRPIAAYEFGPVQMYIYSYDIASRLGPAPP
jgi:hypothetical protein